MTASKNKAAENDVSVEIVSLDTIIYRSHGYELSAFVDRGKKDDGSYELYIDLSATSHWTVPESKPLEDGERKTIAGDIERALKAQGIKAVVEAG